MEAYPDNESSSNIHAFDNFVNKTDESNTHFSNVGKRTYARTHCTLNNNNTPSSHDSDVAFCDTNHFRPQPVDVSTVILIVNALNDTSSISILTLCDISRHSTVSVITFLYVNMSG